MTDLEIVYRDPKDLRPDPRNARTHSADQVQQIRNSQDEFGFTNPILLRDDETTIGAGHGRQEAALLDPPLVRVPTITLRGLTDEQWRAYVLADNQLALNAGWNLDLLRAELLDLRTAGFDLDLTGFGGDELKDLLNPPKAGSRGDPDFVPRALATAVTQDGDVWLLGEHRVTCGDSTDPATVQRALAGQTPHLMVTDPPYGVNYDPSWRNDAIGVNTHRVGVVSNDGRADWREAWALFPGEVAYVWFGSLAAPEVGASLVATGFDLRALVIWNKPKLVPGRGHYHWKHEPCWYAVKKGGTGHWVGGRKQSTVWDIANKDQDAKTAHGTQKPVECMRRPMENNSKPGERVYEPFLGSGTTLIAAQMAKRVCLAVELNPQYVDIAVQRWEAFTGEKAVLEATRQPFAKVQKERAAEANAEPI